MIIIDLYEYLLQDPALSKPPSYKFETKVV